MVPNVCCTRPLYSCEEIPFSFITKGLYRTPTSTPLGWDCMVIPQLGSLFPHKLTAPTQSEKFSGAHSSKLLVNRKAHRILPSTGSAIPSPAILLISDSDTPSSGNVTSVYPCSARCSRAHRSLLLAKEYNRDDVVRALATSSSPENARLACDCDTSSSFSCISAGTDCTVFFCRLHARNTVQSSKSRTRLPGLGPKPAACVSKSLV